MKVLGGAAGAVLLPPLAAAVFVATLVTGAPDPSSAAAATGIPASLLPVYASAARRCPGLSWAVLAAIGWHESRHGAGRVDPATGDTRPPILGPALDGTNGTARMPDPDEPDGFAHAHGPMQFLRSTFGAWAVLAPGRPAGAAPSADNAWDAIHTAAAFLCNGAARLGDVRVALARYNHSDAYVDRVLATAAEYEHAVSRAAHARRAAAAPGPAAPPGTRYTGAVGTAVALAVQQVGKPYVYGARGPDAFDCSGLVVWAFAQVGVHLPRTTYQQVLLGDEVPPDAVAPGDLVFSRGDVPVRDFGHVAIAIGNAMMVVAPRTGDVVKIVPIDFRGVQAVRRVVF